MDPSIQFDLPPPVPGDQGSEVPYELQQLEHQINVTITRAKQQAAGLKQTRGYFKATEPSVMTDAERSMRLSVLKRSRRATHA
eukprot:5006426-Heterocapsa_arctica.AAC.1